MQGLTLLRVILKAFSKTVASEHRPEGNESFQHVAVSGKMIYTEGIVSENFLKMSET